MDTVDRDEVTVSTDGLTIHKSPSVETADTLVTELTVHSTRSDTVRIRLTDTLPDEITEDDVGFHPDYGAQHWDITEDHVQFERELAPNEELTTLYGFRGVSIDELTPVPAEPDVELVTPPTTSEDREQPPDTPTEHDTASNSLPGIDTELQDPVKTPPEPDSTTTTPAPMTDTDPETATDGAGPDDDSSDTGTPDAPPTTDTPNPEQNGVVHALASELRDGGIDTEDKQLLRDELLDTETSTDARIQHLQQKISDLTAYTDALETFLDENGTGKQLIEDVSTRIDSLETTLDGRQTNLDAIESSLDTVSNDVDDLTAQLDDVQETVERHEDLASDIESLDSDVSELQDELDDLADFRERLQAAFGSQMTDE